MLLAVLDVDHERTSKRLVDELSGGWACCPLTENGFVRVLSSPGLLDPDHLDASRLHGHRQVTDAYLLALAVHHHGRLVTDDRRIAGVAVPRATDGQLVVVL